VWAQSAPPLSFDVASIHSSEPGSPTAIFHTEPGFFSTHNVTLRACVEWAYGLKPVQLSGPAWLKDSRFDIVARTDDHGADDDKLRLMLQTLLADRFGMKVHREQKEQQVYSLTIAKNGPKFHPQSAKDASKFLESATEGSSRFKEDKAGAIGEHVSMDETADKISELLDRRVIDRTGLKGRYDFRLDLTPYMAEAEGKADIMSVLFAGFNEQLGLKLEPGKGVVELLVIDAVNKTPTEN
jgi:uncharacterized protein (TIGR03435 family)